VQEGFARALRSRETFRGSGSLEAWIGRCVINAAEDENRKTSAPTATDEPTDAPSAAADAVNGRVREAALRLPQRQRDALFLRYYLDFDYRTIAESLGIEVGTVSATLHAARAALGHALEEVPQ
jgi:RNA polymerase sigma factor (sigma-70 family)